MRLSFPLDSVARSMGLAPKVTSMGKMNVSANFGGDKLKTVIYQIDEVQNLMIYLKIIQFKGLIFKHL